MLGRTLSKSREVVMQDMLDMESVKEVVDLIKFIALSTFLIEAVGAVTLFFRFGAQDGYTVRNLYLAVFHSVSAFCNAGFSLFSKRIGGFDNLEGHCGDVWVNLTVTSLIIVGGLGFPVLRDLIVVGRRRRLGEGRPPRLRTHTKAVLTTTAALIVLGALLLYVLESRGALRGLAPGERVLASYFQSVTARTAGFNTVNIGRLGQATLVVLMCLMFIGASPGSTGGGIKTTTAAVLFQAMRSAFRGRPEVEMFGRTVPRIAIRRAMALVTLSVLLLTLATIALTSVENQPFERLLFEEVSAFGTVGLSAGATGQLTVPGRLIITFLMFLGRVGPLTLMFSLVGETRPASYRYPEARIMVG
jgi:trk system potassium uptake protein TrkH